MSGATTSHAVSTGRAVFVTSSRCQTKETSGGREIFIAPKMLAIRRRYQ
jgi:hypothetical protein